MISQTIDAVIDDKSLMQQLSLIGIDSERFESLSPDNVKALQNGLATGIINLSIEIDGRRTIDMPVKLQLSENKSGESRLMVYCVNRELTNNIGLNEVAFNRLRNGEVLRVSNYKGERIFIQLDRETNNFISIPEKELRLDEKLKSMDKIRDIELGQEQKERIIAGKPVELNVGEEKVTVGLDLKSPEGFKLVKGDMEEWKRRKEIEYDILHHEYLGPVHTDKNRWEYMMSQQKTGESPGLSHKDSNKKEIKHTRNKGFRL